VQPHLAPFFEAPWVDWLDWTAKRRGLVAIRAGALDYVELLVPADLAEVGLRCVVRADAASFTVRMCAGTQRAVTWRCSCGAPRRSMCQHVLRLIGWINHHHCLAVVPQPLRAWRDGVVAADLARREAAAQKQSQVRFVFTRRRAAAGLDELVITPEIVAADGAVLRVGGETTQAQLHALENALSTLSDISRALIVNLRQQRAAGERGVAGYRLHLTSPSAEGFLREILAQYPVHWGSSADPALRIVSPRAAHAYWTCDAYGTQQARLYVAPGTEAVVVLRSAALLFYSREEHAVGMIAGRGRNLGALPELPPVPLDELAAVRAGWDVLLHPDVCPPPPELPPPVPRTSTPRGHVVLEGVCPRDGNTWLVARLEYLYDHFRVTADDPPIPIRCDAETTYALTRDGAAEQQWLARFQAHDWVAFDVAKVPSRLVHPHVASLRARPLASAVLRKELLARVPLLEAAGFAVSLGNDFGLEARDGTDALLRRSVVPAKDGVALGAEIEIDGERYPLLPLIQAALKDPRGPLAPDRDVSPGETWSGVLKGDVHVRLPLERLRALAAPLVDWVRGTNVQLDGRVLLPKLRALSLLAAPEADRIEGVGLIRGMAAQLQTFDRRDLHEVPKGLGVTLLPTQFEAFAFLNRTAAQGLSGGYFDDCGAGKTVVALAHHCWMRAQGLLKAPTLVVAPATPLAAWQRDAPRVAPGERVLDLTGPDRHARFALIPEHDLILTSLDLLRQDSSAIAQHRFGTVLLDEAQSVKNDATAGYEAVRAVRCERIVPLTGTPVENSLDDLYTILDLACPGLFGSRATFAKQLRDPIEVENDTDAIAALRQIAAPFFIRRDIRTLLPDLPPLSENVVRVPVPAAYRDFYAQVHARLSQEARDEGLVMNATTIASLTDALLACDHPTLARHVTAPVTDEPPPKMAEAVARIRTARTRGEHVLVFSRFVVAIDLLEPMLRSAGLTTCRITGQTDDRKGVIEAYQSGSFHAALISTQAGNAGATLTRATRVIFLDQWWTAAVRRQAIARAWRYTQTQSVFVDHLLLEGSVDERVFAVQARKQDLFDAVFGAGDVRLSQLLERDVAELFGSNSLADVAGSNARAPSAPSSRLEASPSGSALIDLDGERALRTVAGAADAGIAFMDPRGQLKYSRGMRADGA
jgi:hypothetical protein